VGKVLKKIRENFDRDKIKKISRLESKPKVIKKKIHNNILLEAEKLNR
jgi:hypothetical protein